MAVEAVSAASQARDAALERARLDRQLRQREQAELDREQSIRDEQDALQAQAQRDLDQARADAVAQAERTQVDAADGGLRYEDVVTEQTAQSGFVDNTRLLATQAYRAQADAVSGDARV